MEPVGKLELQDWMVAAETRAVVAALTAEGGEVRFVGGCVRDAIAGRPVTDVDLATPEAPERVVALLEQAGLQAVPTGIEHGTITAVAGGKPFEVTSLREDVETFGRRARVAFTDDWLADAARRDLTMNALSCAPDGTLFDPFGGLADLRGGRVRFVGAARDRIEEDHLRLLRFFRFQAHYGHGSLDPEGLAAASALAPKLAGLSGERIRAELMKLLKATDPVPVLTVMIERDILAAVLPEARRLDALGRLLRVETAGQQPDSLRRLAALLETDGAGGEAVGRRLRLSKAGWTRLSALMAPPTGFSEEAPPKTLRRFIYRLGNVLAGDLLLLTWARGKASDRAPLRRALAEVETWPAPTFPLRGRDAQALGVPKGPEVGRLVRAVEAWWIEQDFAPDREACLAKLEVLVSDKA